MQRARNRGISQASTADTTRTRATWARRKTQRPTYVNTTSTVNDPWPQTDSQLSYDSTRGQIWFVFFPRSHQTRVGQCPAGAISADGTVAICRILYQTAVWRAPALAPAPAPAQVPAIVRKAWSVDARKDQTHAAHRPTGSKGGDTQREFAGSLSSFDLLPCGSYGGSILGTREHAVPHCHGSLPAR